MENIRNNENDEILDDVDELLSSVSKTSGWRSLFCTYDEDTVSKLISKVSKIITLVISLRIQLRNTKTTIHNLSTKLDTEKNNVKKLQEHNDELANKIRTNRSKCEESYRQIISEYEAKCSAIEKRRVKAANSISTYKKDIIELRNTIKNIRRRHEEELDDLSKKYNVKNNIPDIEATVKKDYRNGQAKFECSTIKTIRLLLASGADKFELSKTYDVSVSTIERIGNYKTYKKCK